MNSKLPATALLVANWQSDVGYAWWLMESYWVAISEAFSSKYRFQLAYPEITRIPDNIQSAAIEVSEVDFNFPDLHSFYTALKFIKSNQVEWIYFTDKPAFSLVYLLYRILGVKLIIVHDHTPGTRSRPGPVSALIKNLVARTPLAADALIAVTDYVRTRHIEVNCFPHEKCFVARNGIQPWHEVATVNLQKTFNIPDGRQIMIMTGRANRYKGVPFVLECLQFLVKEKSVNNLHFLYCGDGPDLEYFKSLASDLGVAEYVSFPGRCDNIPGILSSCSFAIHASKGEVGYSLSILEYMYMKLPVLVPSNPSVNGATRHGETGLVFKEGDVDSASEAILHLLESPELSSRIGCMAKEEVINNYRLENTHKQLVDSIAEVLDNKMAS